MSEPAPRPPQNRRRALLITAAVLVILAAGIGVVATIVGGDDDGDQTASPYAAEVSSWAEAQGFSENPAAVAGAELFAAGDCRTCHTYIGSGTSANQAPDLTAIGASGMGPEFFARYVANPANLGGGTVMPAYGEEDGGPFDEAQLLQLGAFLAASQGID